jgi:integrase/recombinase XerD
LDVDYYTSFESYLEVERGRGERTVAAYVADVQRFRRWLDEHAVERGLPPSWEEVMDRHVRAYLAGLAKPQDPKKRKASPKYIHRITSSLRVWFDYLIEVEKLAITNPARAVAKPKLPKRNPPALSLSEVTRLIQAAVEHSQKPERVRNWTIIAFMFGTGLRISELVDMKESDIRFERGLPASLKVIGKGNKERRVALSQEASTALHQWLKERRYLLAELPPGGDREYVWLIPTGRKRGKRLGAQGVRALLKRYAGIAGIRKNVYPHLLRHTFATEAVKAGARLHALREQLGHTDISTTGLYLHADESELEAVAAVLPRVLGSQD